MDTNSTIRTTETDSLDSSWTKLSSKFRWIAKLSFSTKMFVICFLLSLTWALSVFTQAVSQDGTGVITIPAWISLAIFLSLTVALRARRRERHRLHEARVLNRYRGKELSDELVRRDLCHEKLEAMLRLRGLTLSLVVPLCLLCWILTFILIYYVFSVFIYWLMGAVTLPNSLRLTSNAGLTWALLFASCVLGVATLVILYKYSILYPIANLERKLREVNDEIELRESEDLNLRHTSLRRKLQNLQSRAARVFLDDRSQVRHNEVELWEKQATGALDKDPTSLSELTKTQLLLGLIDERLMREEAELEDQRSWKAATIGVVATYFLLLLFAIFLIPQSALWEVPLLSVPPSILFWGALGGLAAVLYRFYTETSRVRFEAEFRWLIARPLVGIIMGALVYLAISSGLVLFGVESSQAQLESPPMTQATPTPIPETPSATLANEEEQAPQTNNLPAIYLIAAFLAGFSDRFYLGIVNLLATKFDVSSKREIEVTQTVAESTEVTVNSSTPGGGSP